VAFVFIVLELLHRLSSQRVTFTPPRRPPKNRFGFSLLPPSHAPPCTASSR
jgi:hypothetical protein